MDASPRDAAIIPPLISHSIYLQNLTFSRFLVENILILIKLPSAPSTLMMLNLKYTTLLLDSEQRNFTF